MNAENFNFSEKGLIETYKKVTVLLHNVSNFYKDYMQESDKEYTESENLMDKWIISRTEELNKVVEENLEKYNTIKACEFTKKYIDDLSTWYIRNSRDRFNDEDASARKTLRYVLEKIAKALAPIIPFTTEKIWQDLNGKDSSVHLQDYPKPNLEKINPELEDEMETVREIVSSGLRQRDISQISLKWPLQKAFIKTQKIPRDEEFDKIIKMELNIKETDYEHSDIFGVELDTNITPELESEGFAREISRKVQALRKKAGLVKSDNISLSIIGDIVENLQSQVEFMKERVGASELAFEKQENMEISENGKIKDKSFEIAIRKL